MKNMFKGFILLSTFCFLINYAFELKDGKVMQKKWIDEEVEVTPMYNVSKVHVIFMNHLDIGYNGVPGTGFINNVLNTYFQKYFPLAVQVYNSLVAGAYAESFIYTTHPWLVDLYLNCPPNLNLSGIILQCPTNAQVEAFNKVVKSGNITWHSGAMNYNYDLYNDFLLDATFNLSAGLDKLFGIQREYQVISQRDVPGLTQALIPGLLRNGITGITGGVNPGSASPNVPFLFRWQNMNQQEVIYMINKGGYPNNPGPTPNNPGGAGINQCRWIDGVPEVLCWGFKGDNQGPPTVQEILSFYEIYRAQFPVADVFASTFDNFFKVLWQNVDKLPVVTQEIGDTWTQGVSSDPKKLADYKTILRSFTDCYEQTGCYNPSDPRLINATRFLLKPAEHTFGLPSSYDNVHYANSDLPVFLASQNAKNNVKAWTEQRYFNNLTLQALQNHPIYANAVNGLQELQATYPDVSEYSVIDYPFQSQFCAAINSSIMFARDGSISSFIVAEVPLADSNSRLGQILYKTYNETDTNNFVSMYGGNPGYGRYNSTANAHPQSQWWPVELDELYRHNTEPCKFAVKIVNSDPLTYIWYGAPKEYWMFYTIPIETKGYTMNIELQLVSKTITRLMEAIYLNFQLPNSKMSSNVKFNKVGNYPVSPTNVVQGGSQWQHAVSDYGVEYSNAQQQYLKIVALDSPLVCPVTETYGPTVWPVPLAPIPNGTINALSFNIYNNIWTTNYIFWYPYVDGDDGLKFRFSLCWDRSFCHSNFTRY